MVAVASAVLSAGAVAHAQTASTTVVETPEETSTVTTVVEEPGTSREERALEARRRWQEHHLWDHHAGWEATLHLGVGGHVHDTATAFTDAPSTGVHLFWPGFGGQFTAGHRFVHWMSVGTHFGYIHYWHREQLPGHTNSHVNGLSYGFYGRIYFGQWLNLRRWELWLSAGVDVSATLYIRSDTAIGTAQTQISTVAIPISVSGEYLVHPNLALGVLLQVSPWIPWEICNSASGTPIVCNYDHLEVNTYLFGGIGLRLILPR
jgi:hypothetical protein